MTKFRIGDHVRIINPDSPWFDRVGTIASFHPGDSRYRYEVSFDDGEPFRHKAEELTLAEPDPRERTTRGMIHTFVPGTPVPQGSVDVYRGRVVSVKAPLRKWRDSIRAATMARHEGEPLDGPITVQMVFQLPRPKRPRWPLPAVKPDGDKLCRAAFDALSTTKTQAGVITDDARIVSITAAKTYHGTPGVMVTITQTGEPANA